MADKSVSIVSNQSLNNGYETAIDDSNTSSLYYSMNSTLINKTLEPDNISYKRNSILDTNLETQTDKFLKNLNFISSTPTHLNEKNFNINSTSNRITIDLDEDEDFIVNKSTNANGSTASNDESTHTIVNGALHTDDIDTESSIKSSQSIIISKQNDENKENVKEVVSNKEIRKSSIKLPEIVNNKRQSTTRKSFLSVNNKASMNRKLLLEKNLKKLNNDNKRKTITPVNIDVNIEKKLSTISGNKRKTILQPTNDNKKININLKQLCNDKDKKNSVEKPVGISAVVIKEKKNYLSQIKKNTPDAADKRVTLRRSLIPTNSGNPMKPTNKDVRKTINFLTKKTFTSSPAALTTNNYLKRKTITSNPIRKSVRLSMMPTSKSATAPSSSLTTITENESNKTILKQPDASLVIPSKPEMKKPTTINTNNFHCNICNKNFRLKTTLLSHEKLHNNNKIIDLNNKICIYCDKKFVLNNALEKHLIEYCEKIPVNKRKELLYPKSNYNTISTEVPKIKKQLSISSNESIKSKISSRRTTIMPSGKLVATGANTTVQPVKKITKIEEPSTAVTTETTATSEIMVRPSTGQQQKSAKKIPHSGVYCTPNKTINCCLCKLTFPDVLSFTVHSEIH